MYTYMNTYTLDTLITSLLYISWAPKYILSTNKFTLLQYIASPLVSFGKRYVASQF